MRELICQLFRFCYTMMQMMKFNLLLLVTVILISACSALSEQPSVALALENPGQPFRSGVEIAKPTYTPSPTATSSPTPVPPTTIPTPLPTDTPSPAVFAEDAFVVIENLSAPASAGYDSTTQYDTPPTYNGSKYILVDISEQHMYVYEGDALVYSFIASTGMGNSTRVGNFSVLNKIPNAYGATWNIWMPNWLGIYWAGSMQNGIHALPILPNGATLWAGYLGTPISYGCIVLGSYEAQLLYNWADIGTPVEIRW
jgi:lipoprotein-anchoring transpeptidase ErfK/SrfK